MRLIGTAGQRAIDAAWHQQTGLPLIQLMEAAAHAVVRLCRQLAQDQGQEVLPVLVLCGRGHNGGDAFASARLLAALGWPVACRQLDPDATLPPEAEANRQAWLKLGHGAGAPIEADFELERPGLILDGLFGTGFLASRGLPEQARAISQNIARARDRGHLVVSIDIPSGVEADNGCAADDAVQADFTVSFIRPKIGLCSAPGHFLAGRVVVDPIGVDAALADRVLDGLLVPPVTWLTGDLLRPWCPVRPPDGHKGLFGKVLLAGGSVQMPGALALAGEAAGRSGIGLLQLALPAALSPALAAACPEALQLPLESQVDLPQTVLPALEQARAAAIGPGIGRPAWLGLLLELLIRHARRLVIDADALNEISRTPDRYGPLLLARKEQGFEPAVLTPHPGEFRRLAPDIDQTDRLAAARTLAARTGCLVVLKGACTVIADPGGACWLNTTGQDGLARGGSGDLLTGLIAGFLAQGLPAWQAAGAAVYVHGLAADLAARDIGRRAMLPRDVLRKLGSALRRIGWEEEDV